MSSRGRNLINDGRVLWHLVCSPVRGASHEERLESFYGKQAAGYDDFRRRFLHGRRELIESVNPAPGAVWLDLGAGTGDNLHWFGDRVADFSAIHLVDLSPSLLDVARRRVADQPGLSHAHVHHADATEFDLGDESVDLITFSYSLTMIPDWFAALERAWAMLKPGGQLGVVDFFVSRKHPREDEIRHRWPSRLFWTTWFSFDNVFLSADHLGVLRRKFETMELHQSGGKIPYLPLLRAPYYVWIGRKPELEDQRHRGGADRANRTVGAGEMVPGTGPEMVSGTGPVPGTALERAEVRTPRRGLSPSTKY